jgi:hypothetical protein
MLLQTTGAGNLLTDALYSVVIEPDAIKAAESTARVLIENLTGLGTLILSIILAVEIARSSLLSERIDGMKLVRGFLTLLIFINYNEVMGKLNELLCGIFEALPAASTKNLIKEMPATEFSIFSLSNFLTSNVCLTLAWIIQLVVLFIRKIIILFLYCSGPISLLLSMVPSFGDGILKNWIKNYVSVQCWALTIFILNTLFLFYTNNTKSGHESGQIMYITFTILYLIVPILTNKYISAQSNSLMSRLVGVTTGLALMSSKIISTISKGSKAASAAGSSIGAKAPDLASPMKQTTPNAHGAPQFETKMKGGFRAAYAKKRQAEN